MCLSINKEMNMKNAISHRCGTALLAVFLFLAAGLRLSAQIPDYGQVYYWNLAKGNINFTPGTAEGYIWLNNQWTEVGNSTYALTDAVMWIVMDPDNRFNGDLSSLADYQKPVTTTSGNSNGVNIVNNSGDVAATLKEWKRVAELQGRPSTDHWISVACNVGYSIVLDNIWSTYQEGSQGSTQGGLSFKPQSDQPCVLNVVLKGDNRFGNIFYCSHALQYPGGPLVPSSGLFEQARLIFKSYKGFGSTEGTLTVGNIDPDARYYVDSTNGNVPMNFYNSVIGGSDSFEDSYGIQIDGGTIYAGAQPEDVCTAIGGGGNGIGAVTINGGQVTAVTSSTGTAIGGGIGWTEKGGKAIVTITGGDVYAYNKGLLRNYEGDIHYVPAAAIGGGSSFKRKCEDSSVTISGGTVYAESVGGVAIGGGGSGFADGGKATISISGASTKIWAKSKSGGTASHPIPAGTSIGGGTGGIGGLTGDELADNGPGNGGDCEFSMTGGTLNAGSVGGGSSNNPDPDITIGHAVVNIEGGDIRAQFVMAKGSRDHCEFKMSGGTIENSVINDPEYHLVKNDGGAVWMNDPDGKVSITGGTIRNCKASSGGAVYTTGGEVTVNGATITECQASNENGGAIAVMSTGAAVTLSNATVTKNTAHVNGGAFFLSPNATVTITGGRISGNTALQNGGAFYGSEGAKITMLSGSIEDNSAYDGGGVYLASDAKLTYTTGSAGTGFIRRNHASNLGGGVFLAKGTTTAKTQLEFVMNSSTSLGFYDNIAEVGADDIYAFGEGTTRMTIPSVNGMDLGGYSLFGATLQWWEDYQVDDPRYGVGTGQGDPAKVRRYRASRDTVEPIWRVPRDPAVTPLSSFEEKYLCLTLGFEYGTLEIRRSGLEPRENAIYKIEFVGTSLDRPTQYVTILGTTEAEKTVIDGVAWNIARVGFLPQGRYKVTELNWTWYNANDPATSTPQVVEQDISTESGRVYLFKNTHADLGDTPLHDEELKVNELIP